jgi:hypothetical protein
MTGTLTPLTSLVHSAQFAMPSPLRAPQKANLLKWKISNSRAVPPTLAP